MTDLYSVMLVCHAVLCAADIRLARERKATDEFEELLRQFAEQNAELRRQLDAAIATCVEQGREIVELNVLLKRDERPSAN